MARFPFAAALLLYVISAPSTYASVVLPTRTCTDGLELFLPYLAQQTQGIEYVKGIRCNFKNTNSSIPQNIGVYSGSMDIEWVERATNVAFDTNLQIYTFDGATS